MMDYWIGGLMGSHAGRCRRHHSNIPTIHYSAAASLHSAIGARGGIRTRTGDALNVVPLLVGLREQMKWILQPVLPRQELFTKEIRPDASEHGGGNGRSLRCCPGPSGLMKPP